MSIDWSLGSLWAVVHIMEKDLFHMRSPPECSTSVIDGAMFLFPAMLDARLSLSSNCCVDQENYAIVYHTGSKTKKKDNATKILILRRGLSSSKPIRGGLKGYIVHALTGASAHDTTPLMLNPFERGAIPAKDARWNPSMLTS